MDDIKTRYFEDIQVGDRFTSVGRTITETDIVNYAGLSGDYNLIHTDAEFAKGTLMGQRIAHGMLVMCISSGLFTRTPYCMSFSDTLVAASGIKEWRFRKPVLIGDTIYNQSEVIEKIDHHAERGKVLFKRSILNQRGEIVQEGLAELTIAKRPKGV
jgi:acyl dehydratase